MTKFQQLKSRLRSEYPDQKDALDAAAAIEELEKEFERLKTNTCAQCFENNYINTLLSRIEQLETTLKLMIDTQDDWEKSVAKVIGKEPQVFDRAVNFARKVLEN